MLGHVSVDAGKAFANGGRKRTRDWRYAHANDGKRETKLEYLLPKRLEVTNLALVLFLNDVRRTTRPNTLRSGLLSGEGSVIEQREISC
jgi:hypothetical protein